VRPAMRPGPAIKLRPACVVRANKRAGGFKGQATRSPAPPARAPRPRRRGADFSQGGRSAPVVAPKAARTASSPSRRIVLAKIRLATFEHAMMKTKADTASRTQSTVFALDVIWSRSITASIWKFALAVSRPARKNYVLAG
jgi:hypothetical protein